MRCRSWIVKGRLKQQRQRVRIEHHRKWDTRGKKPNDHVGNLGAPLFLKSLYLLKDDAPLGGANNFKYLATISPTGEIFELASNAQTIDATSP